MTICNGCKKVINRRNELKIYVSNDLPPYENLAKLDHDLCNDCIRDLRVLIINMMDSFLKGAKNDEKELSHKA
jgi:hypothetical protein